MKAMNLRVLPVIFGALLMSGVAGDAFAKSEFSMRLRLSLDKVVVRFQIDPAPELVDVVLVITSGATTVAEKDVTLSPTNPVVEEKSPGERFRASLDEDGKLQIRYRNHAVDGTFEHTVEVTVSSAGATLVNIQQALPPSFE